MFWLDVPCAAPCAGKNLANHPLRSPQHRRALGVEPLPDPSDVLRQLIAPRWRRTVVPDEAYDLLERLLHPDPVQRITPSEALQHPFITGTWNPTIRALDIVSDVLAAAAGGLPYALPSSAKPEANGAMVQRGACDTEAEAGLGEGQAETGGGLVHRGVQMESPAVTASKGLAATPVGSVKAQYGAGDAEGFMDDGQLEQSLALLSRLTGIGVPSA